MPESVRDRCTKAHEYIFLMSKSPKYYYDQESIRENSEYPNGPNSPKSIKIPYGQGFSRKNTAYSFARKTATQGKPGAQLQHRPTRTYKEYRGMRNRHSVWTVATTQPFPEAHFATFPPKLIEPCIFAGTKPGDTILAPIIGSGTTAVQCEKYGRKWIGVDLGYMDISTKRIWKESRQLKLFN